LVPARLGAQIDAGESAFADLFAAAAPPTAIAAATNVLAIGIMFAAQARGIAVPGALSVVGFDDIPLASATFPGLTTARMPVADMVAAAVDIAIADGSEDGRDTTAVFTPQLIVRRSTGTAPV
jgi:LacI family transcriptional regulator